MHAYSILPPIPLISQYWVVVLAIGVALRIGYEWVGTYRRDRTWARPTQYTLLGLGGLIWAPLFLSPA